MLMQCIRESDGDIEEIELPDDLVNDFLENLSKESGRTISSSDIQWVVDNNNKLTGLRYQTTHSRFIRLEIKFNGKVKSYRFDMQKVPDYQDVSLMINGDKSFASHLCGLTDKKLHEQLDLTARQLFPIPYTRNSRTLMHIALAEYRRRNPLKDFDTYVVDFDGDDQ